MGGIHGSARAEGLPKMVCVVSPSFVEALVKAAQRAVVSARNAHLVPRRRAYHGSRRRPRKDNEA